MTDLSPLAQSRPRVALLVDGENLGATRAAAMLDLARKRGEVLIARAYGKLADLQAKGWGQAAGFRLVAATGAKNAADLLLSVDAMELALEGRADALVIATCDTDYAHVASKLRERGFPVFGLIDGTARSEGLRACFAGWAELPPAASQPAAPKARPPAPQSPAHQPAVAPPDPAADRLFTLVTAHLRSHPQGCPIATLGPQMHKSHGIQISQTPHKTWRAFLAAHPDRFLCDPKGPEARVRLGP